MNDEILENAIAEFTKSWREKFQKGRVEHGGTNFWLKRGMLAQAQNEHIDLGSYHTAIEFQLNLALQYLIAGEYLKAQSILENLLAEPED